MKTLKKLLTANSIAVIGASTHPEKVGYQILRNLRLMKEKANTKQKLFPINPTATTIQTLNAYPSLTAIKTPVELVIIVTPVGTILPLVDEIITRNRHLSGNERVHSVIIISAGFAETDAEGGTLQRLIMTKLQLAGIQLLGPNTLGVVAPSLGLNASFAQDAIPIGRLGVISQSGAMLSAIFHSMVDREIGISFAISLGNKADINENDCLDYALTDPDTTAVILYLESFHNLPEFFGLCSRLCLEKPVVVLKGGTSARGQTASASHTAALATNQVLLQAASKQIGFTLVENMEELLSVAFFLAQHRQLPENTMVLTNAGGPAVNTIDQLASAGVPLAEWSTTSKASFDDHLPQIKVANPLDLLGDASPEKFRFALQVAQKDVNIESILVIITPQAVTDIDGITEQLLLTRGRKPIFVAMMGGDHLEPARRKLRKAGILSTSFANNLVDVLKTLRSVALAKYNAHTFVSSRSHQLPSAQAVVKPPSLDSAFKLMENAGFHLPKYRVVKEASELLQIPFPSYVKTANLALLHKKKMGAVYGVVKNHEEAKKAFEAMQKFGNEVLFQEVLEIEHEFLLGIEQDPQFGMYMSVGMGGSYTNILADRVYVFLPAAKEVLRQAWHQTKAYQALHDRPEISELMIEQMFLLTKLVMKEPQIHSLEINPLALSSGTLWVADLKMQQV